MSRINFHSMYHDKFKICTNIYSADNYFSFISMRIYTNIANFVQWGIDSWGHRTTIRDFPKLNKFGNNGLRRRYRSGTVNSNTVNSKFHLIGSYCEIFFYHFPNISCLKCTVNSNFHLIRSETLLTNDFELTVPNLYHKYYSQKNYLQWGLNQGSLVLYSDIFLTELTWLLRSLYSNALLILVKSSKFKNQLVHKEKWI